MAEITHKTLFGKIISLKLLPSSFLSFHVFFFYNFLEMCNNYPMLFEGTDLVLFFFLRIQTLYKEEKYQSNLIIYQIHGSVLNITGYKKKNKM